MVKFEKIFIIIVIANFGKHYAKTTVQVLTEHLAEKQAPIAISTNGKEKMAHIPLTSFLLLLHWLRNVG